MAEALLYVGDTAPLAYRYAVAGAPVDPVDLTLVIKLPGGIAVTKVLADIDHLGTGSYWYGHPITEAGEHRGYFQVSEPEAEVSPFRFYVEPLP